MKGFVLALTLAVSLGFTACSKSNPQPATSTSQASAVLVESTTGHHECGAMTKAGKPCTRRVSDKHGKDARCWQHQ